MPQCDWQTFEKITPAIWERIKKELADSHEIVGPVADSGTQTASGYTVTWRYLAESQVFQVQVTSPWFAACSLVNPAVAEGVAKAKLGP